MTYIRLDDHFPQHRKILGLDDSAFALYVRSICYCATQLSNGHVIMAALPLLTRHRKPLNLVAQLVEAELWEITLNGWQVHDYLDWQESADSVLGKRAAARERMQRLRSQDVRTNNERSSHEVPKSSQKVREQDVDTENREQKTETDLKQNPPVGPPSSGRGTAPAKRRAEHIPQDWQPSATLTAWATTNHPGIDVRLETERFTNHAVANGRTLLDWDAGWRNWVLKAEEIHSQHPNGNGNGNGTKPSNRENLLAAMREDGLIP